jgi:hypothetical protein
MANLSPASVKLKTVDMTGIEINFFHVIRDMEKGKVRTVIDRATGETCFVPEKLYKQLLEVA